MLYRKYIQTFLGALTLTLAACSQPVEDNDHSSLDLIVAEKVGDQQGAVIEIKGFQDFDIIGREYYISIGDKANLHPVRGCESSDELFRLLDLEPKDLGSSQTSSSKDALLKEGYTEASTLYCSGDKLPEIANSQSDNTIDGELLMPVDREMYFDGISYYVGTGLSDEYYAINTDNAECAFDFMSVLFAFDLRFDFVVYEKPITNSDNKIINISCQNAVSNTYGLVSFNLKTPSINGGLVLLYNELKPNGETITSYFPIYAIDGVLINDDLDKKNRGIEKIKKLFGINELSKINPSSFANQIIDKTWLDICVDSCNDELINSSPAVIGRGFRANPAINSKIQAEQTTRLSGQKAITWQPHSQESISFVECDNEVVTMFGLKVEGQSWFDSVKSDIKGLTVNSGKTLVCPREANPNYCDRILSEAEYSVRDFNKLLSDTQSCEVGSQLRLRLDAPIRIKGRSPVSIYSSGFSKITIESYLSGENQSLTYVFECSDASCNNSSVANIFNIATGDTVEFRNINLNVEVLPQGLEEGEVPSLLFRGLQVSNLTDEKGTDLRLIDSNIQNSQMNGNSLIYEGVRVDVDLSCGSFCDDLDGYNLSSAVIYNSNIDATNTAVNMLGGRLIVANAGKDSGNSLHAGELAIALSDDAQALVYNAEMNSKSMMSFGFGGKSYISNSSMRLTGNSLDSEISAFSFFNDLAVSPFVLEIVRSEIRGLPAIQLSNFTFADFSFTQEPQRVNLVSVDLYRNDLQNEGDKKVATGDLSLFLSCKGEGRLNYRFRNYCN